MMKKPSPYLTFAGTIPFIACAIFMTMNIDKLPLLGPVIQVLTVYGLVIATFMAGAQWGNHLNLTDDNSWALRLPIASNIIALTLWLGFLVLSLNDFIWLLIIIFAILLVIDYGLNQAKIIDNKYFKVRKYVTTIVITSLLVAVFQV